MKTYVIKPGCSFRVSETEILGAGELIELPDDVAALHAAKVELVDDSAAMQPASASSE